MNMYQLATRSKLRFASSKGNLTVEQLWDLPLTALDTIARDLHKELKEEETVSFITTSKTTNKEAELRFAIVKDVIAVRLKEREEAENAAAILSEKKRLDALIANKKDEALASASIEDLEARRAALG